MPLYNKVIQDVIDEENREDEGGFFDEGSPFRTGAAIGTEVGLNFLLDMFSLAAPLQYSGGAGINYLAQRIRGGEFNEGEMVASGLASLIPGGAQLKAVRRGTRFGAAAGKGALSGGIQVTGEKLINEGEFPTFEEFGTATTLGATFGGAFDLAPAAFKGKLGDDVSEIFDDIGNRIDDTSYDMMGKFNQLVPDIIKEGGVMDIGAGGLKNSWSLSQGVDPIKNQILVKNLENNPRMEKWLIGNTRTISKKNANLVQEIADDKDFMSLMTPKFAELKQKYPHLVKQIGDKETLLLRWHHVNPSKGGIDLYKGLTKVNDRMELNKYLIDEVGIYSGNHPLNNRGLSIDVHDQIHSWLGERMGLRADVLKYKWAKKLGIDVGELSPGKGFMADHLVLSKEGNQAWDDYFSKLTPEQRKPFFKEYGEVIKESDGILDDLMKQYDSLYAMPEGFQAVIPDEVLIEFLDNIPTDGSRLLQKDIRAIVEQVAADMPRGTLDIINEAGDVRRLDLESKVYKRLQEAKIELDEKGLSRRKINSLKSEIKGLEKGIYQEAIDFKGAEKQAAWKKRLEQEKSRREGKK